MPAGAGAVAKDTTLCPLQRIDEAALTGAIVALASEYGRYGYRRITVQLRQAGWPVGKDRVQRIWRREGLKVPAEAEATRAAMAERWFLRAAAAERANHVWSYDFVSAMTHDGRMLRMLVLIDEYTRECLAIRVARRLGNYEVIETLADVMVWRGIPEHIRSDNGPEFVAKELRSGWRRWERERCTSSPAVRGRTAIARASTESCGMSA